MRLALALVLLVAFPVVAFNEPSDFRGVPWGATQSQAQDILLKNWQPGSAPLGAPTCTPAKGICMQSGKLGPIEVTFGYTFREDQFVSGIVLFKSADYPAVRRIFDERYGEPTKRWREEVRSKAGVPHEQEASLWKGAKVSVMLNRFGQRLDQGRAGVALNEIVEQDMAAREKALKKGKDDL
jgi:hypothetical protein